MRGLERFKRLKGNISIEYVGLIALAVMIVVLIVTLASGFTDDVVADLGLIKRTGGSLR